jgi:lipopolysaccharide transport system ATP-binding protein
MSDHVIRVENLGKRYHLGVLRHDTLRDRLAHALRAPLNRLRGLAGPDPTEFWALRDVSFEVRRGEVLGIIGRNGAGKSTLLKILSRITEPTAGCVRLRGRVASLLEVGTGFHPELTGRENVFLNGAILGMSRAEIRRKFDEIVAFAEIERFLDTPVKRYSSGMYVRLAFAVAAHLEPEILIVDEVLAVGDAEFQKKCIGRMHAVSRQGRTVLFVSHNVEALAATCASGMLLDKGRIMMRGPISDVLATYQNPGVHATVTFPARAGSPAIRAIKIDSAALDAGELRLEVTFEAARPFNAILGVVVSTLSGRPVFGTNMCMHPPYTATGEIACGCGILSVPRLPLHTDQYTVSVWLGDGHTDFDHHERAVSFSYFSRRRYQQRPALSSIGHGDFECDWVLEPNRS